MADRVSVADYNHHGAGKGSLICGIRWGQLGRRLDFDPGGVPRLDQFGVLRGRVAIARGDPDIALEIWVTQAQEAT